MTENFAILRHDSTGYSTRGPTAPKTTLEQARKEIAKLQSAYPHQEFVIMGVVGRATRSKRVTVRIQVPDVSGGFRKRPKPTFEPNVIPLQKEQSG